jgi:hypothetical protein
MSGHYIETQTIPNTTRSASNDWYFTPCGDGCADMSNPATGGGARAMLANGQWTMDISMTPECGNGTSVDNAVNSHYTWDPNTLAGPVKNTVVQAACGTPVGFTYTSNVQLRKAD